MKIKFLYLSCLFLSLSLFVSCGLQEETLPTTIEPSIELADRLSADANFQEIVSTIHVKGEVATIVDRTPSVVANFPELIELEKEVIAEVIERAVSKINLPATVTLRCANGSAYDSCAYNAWLDYVHSYYACSTNACRASMNQAITQAYAICFSWYC